MEPIEIIVGALGVALANMAEPLVKRAYHDFKDLIKRKFGIGSDVDRVLERFEKNPGGWGDGLKEVLQEVDAGADEEIETAIKLLQRELQALQEQDRLQPGISIGGSVTGSAVIGGSVSGDVVVGDQVAGDKAGGDILKDHARKIDTGGGDYVEGGTKIEQNVSNSSHVRMIGIQKTVNKEEDEE